MRALPSFLLLLLASPLLGQTLRLVDAYPDKARYFPSEPVSIILEFEGTAKGNETVSATIAHLDRQAGSCQSLTIRQGSADRLTMACKVPAEDYQGYLVSVSLNGPEGRVLAERTTALDISSDWKRFPRYGYLAHYNQRQGAEPQKWMDELNRFHINGLEFYDSSIGMTSRWQGALNILLRTGKILRGDRWRAELFADSSTRHTSTT